MVVTAAMAAAGDTGAAVLGEATEVAAAMGAGAMATGIPGWATMAWRNWQQWMALILRVVRPGIQNLCCSRSMCCVSKSGV